MARHISFLDEEEYHEKWALTLRTVGALLLIEAFIVCEWIWMGMKAGSDFWLITTFALIILGLICYAGAELQHRKALENVRLRFEQLHPAAGEPSGHRVA